jgi:hypothetical protein
MTRRELEGAGWASVVSAIVTIPGILIAFISALAEYRRLGAICSVASLLLLLWIYGSFRRLLNDLYEYDGADTAINALLGSSILATVLGLLTGLLAGTGVADLVAFLSVGAFVVFGIAYVVFSVKLLRLEAPLFGFAKPLGYAGLAQGITVASVILIPLGVLASIVADVMRAQMFFAAAADRRGTCCPDCDEPILADATVCFECGAAIVDPAGVPEESWDEVRRRVQQV